MGCSHASIEPQGFQRKSSAPQRMSWRAGIHGSDPVTWRVKRVACRAANRSRFGVVNSVPPYEPSRWRFKESSRTTQTLLGFAMHEP